MLAFGLWRWRRSPWLRLGVLAWYVFGVLVVALAVRYPPSPYTTPQAVEAAIGSGQPTFIMLYSNYCLGCLGTLARCAPDHPHPGSGRHHPDSAGREHSARP
ncbi:hypothetical protein HC776_01490 [bacterium]|nr:hypothetical protein [bacterium]